MKAPWTARVRMFIHAIPRRLAAARVGSLLIIATFCFTLLAAFFPPSVAVGFVRGIGQALELDSLANAYQLNFQERFESPTFMLLIGAVCLSLCFSLFFRIRRELKRYQAPELPAGVVAPPRSGASGVAVAKIERELKQRGYRTYIGVAEGAWQVHGSKGGSGVWGSVLFHVSILLFIVAAVLTASASFHASVKLVEGQAFDARTDPYGTRSVGRWYMPRSQPLTFRLTRVEPEFDAEGADTVASIIEPTLEGKSTRFAEPAPVYLLHGMRHAGMTIHQGVETGYAPLVMIDDAADNRVYEGYTRLATMKGTELDRYYDFIELNEKNIRVELELMPDAVYRNGMYINRSGAKKNPVLHVILREHGKLLLDEFIPITRDVSAAGYKIFFGGLRRWSQIDVVDAPGVPVLMAATLLGALGLLLRLLSVRRRVEVSLSTDESRPAALEVSGSAEKFSLAFEEELASLRVALAERLADGLAVVIPPMAQLSNE